MHKNIFKIFLKNFEIVEKGGFSEVKSFLKQKNPLNWNETFKSKEMDSWVLDTEIFHKNCKECQ